MYRKSVLIGSVILYVVACSVPALEFRRNEEGVEIWAGFQLLLLGWLGPLLGHIAWLANPLLILAGGFLFLQKRRASIICASLALLIGLETFTLFNGSIPGDEADVNKLYLRHLREGAYFWFASMVVVLIGGFLCRTVPTEKSISASVDGAGEVIENAWE